MPPRPDKSYAIHTDNVGGDYVKMNWIFGGKDSLMQWYNVNPGVNKEPVKTAINSLYMSFTKDEVTMSHAQTVKFPTIVQVGIPHNIYNPTEDRFCVSVMLRDNNNLRMTMEQAQKIFASYITL